MRKDGMDRLDELIEAHVNENVVAQMTDVQVREVSTVDEPATGRRLRFFKRLWNRARGKQQEDLTGFGADQPGEPRGGGAPLANLDSCLNAHPDWSPAQCEAEAALLSSMEADREGDDSTVSDPPTAGDFNSAKDEHLRPMDAKPEALEECVQAVLADPEFAPGEDDRESRAYAVCSEQQLRRAPMPRNPRKQDELEPMPVEAPAMDAVEVPASPTAWPFATCIQDAMDYGLDQDSSIAVCQLVRQDLGDPDDEESILLPDGMTPEGTIQMAAIQAGIMKPEGMGGGESGGGEGEEMPEQQMRFSGKNRWEPVKQRLFRQAIGLDTPKSMTDRTVGGLRKEVDLLKTKQTSQELLLKTLLAGKSKDQLIELLMGQNAALLENAGIILAKPDAAPATTPAETAGAEAEAAAVVEGEGKAKSDLDESEREELDRLRALTATGSGTGEPAAEEPEPADDSGAPPPGIALVDDPPVEPAPVTAEPAKAKRASIAPSSPPGRGSGELVTSSILGGARIPAADREAISG